MLGKRTPPPGGLPAARVTPLQGLTLVLCSIAIGCLLAEGVARLLLPPPEQVRVDTSPDLDRRLAAENQEPKSVSYRGAINAMFIKTPTGRRLRANTTVTIENHYLSHRTIVVRTNSLGFRGPELGEPQGTRVLFLGDSITMAHYLPEDETFVGLVGALSRETGAPLETVNAGVGGIGAEAELAILTETGVRAHPRIVVLDFYLNDVQQSPGVRLLEVPAALRWSRLAQYVARSVPMFLARNDWEIGAGEMNGWLEEIRRRFPAGPGDPAKDPGAFNALVQENYQDWGSAWSEGAWARLEPILAEFKRQADLNGFELLIACFPVEPQVAADFAADAPQRRLAEAGGRLGVPVLDLLPSLRAARAASPEPLFYDVCHHTARGSRVIAEAILEFIRQHPAR